MNRGSQTQIIQGAIERPGPESGTCANRPILYHNDMSVCAAKVRMLFAEKDIDWEGVHLNLRAGDSQKPDYVKLNPNKVVPTLLHDGDAIIESNVICEYVEDVWPERPLRPDLPRDRARMRIWMKQLDESIHAATAVVSTCVAFRLQHLKRDPRELKAWLAGLDPARRERTQSAIDLGIEAPQFKTAVLRLEQMAADMDTSLQQGAWLAGNHFSLADIAYASYMARFQHLGTDQPIATRPRLREWRDRLYARPSFRAGIERWFNPHYLEIFDAERSKTQEKVKEILAAAQ